MKATPPGAIGATVAPRSRRRLALGRLVIAALFATAAAVGWRAIWGWDIGFYLSLGRWIAEHRAVPRVDPLTFTLAGQPFLDMYWLYELGAWGLFALGGTLALTLGHVALTLASMALALARTAQRSRTALFPAALLSFLFVFGNTWETRPHAVSWLCLNALLLVLERRRRGAPAALWVLPALMALWANTHPLFALGVAVLGVYTFAELLRGRAADRGLLALAFCAVTATLLTPHGVRGWLVPLQQLRNLGGDSAFKSAFGILEYRNLWDFSVYGAGVTAPWYHSLPHLHAWLLAALLASPFFWRRAAWGERLVFALTLVAFVGARKNFGYCFFAALPLVADGWAAAGRALARAAGRGRAAAVAAGLRRAAAATALVATALAIVHAGNGYFHAARQLGDARGHAFNPHTLPVQAAEFLNRSDVPAGHMLNALHDGGYLSFATRRPVFIDGRLELFGPEVYRAHLASLHPAALGRTILAHDIRLVVVPYGDIPSWFEALTAQRAWRCVHLDSYAALFFRQDFAQPIRALVAGPALPAPDVAEERRILDRGTALGQPGFLASLRGPHYVPLAQARLCRAYLELGLDAAAVATGLDGLRHATFDDPGLLLNLGSAYWRLGRKQEAALCYRAWLRPRPGHRPDAARIAEVRLRLAAAPSP